MDPWNDPGAQEWIAHVDRTLVPMLDDSCVSVSIAPPVGAHDIKYAVELGLSILMDKPILLVVGIDKKVPPKLRSIADDIAYVDWADPASVAKLAKRTQEFAARFA